MPTATYIALANTTISSATSNVTFSSIPSSYRDLVLVVNGSTNVGSGAGIRFNGDSGANYSIAFMFGTSGVVQSEQYSGVTEIGIGAFQSSGMMIHHIMDYSATNKHKTVLVRRDTPTYVVAGVGRWANNNAITSLTFTTYTNTMQSGTTLSLYGIAS